MIVRMSQDNKIGIATIRKPSGRVYRVYLNASEASYLGNIQWRGRFLLKAFTNKTNAINYKRQVIKRLVNLRIIHNLVTELETYKTNYARLGNQIIKLSKILDNQTAEYERRYTRCERALEIVLHRYRYFEVLRLEWQRLTKKMRGKRGKK